MKTFLIGAVGYGGLEILWRGRTHPSMLMAGGICLCAIKRLCRFGGGVCRMAVRSALLITTVELAVGLICNRRKTVWDYSAERGNFLGQICPKYTLLWALLSLPIVLCFKKREL